MDKKDRKHQANTAFFAATRAARKAVAMGQTKKAARRRDNMALRDLVAGAEYL